jgi:hypothetical protein
LWPKAAFAAALPVRVRTVASGWALQLLGTLHGATEGRHEFIRRWRGGGPSLRGALLLIGKGTRHANWPAERAGFGWIHRGPVKRCRHELRPRLTVWHE